MASYILRGIDPELWKRVKSAAALDDLTIKALIETLLADYLIRRVGKG